MNFSLSAEQQTLRNSIISFAKEKLNHHLKDIEKQSGRQDELMKLCAANGLTGLPVEGKYGGRNLDPESVIVALESLGYASLDGGLNFSLCAQLLASTVPLQQFGTEEQKQKYLPSICDGTIRAANAISEVGSGSDISFMKSRAVMKGDHYILNGRKSFISNGPSADLIIVYAITDETKSYHGGITAFLVDKKSTGVSSGPVIEKMGLTSCLMSELVFENVELNSESILGGIGGGTMVFNYSMEWERIGIAACQAGTMEYLIEKCIDFAHEHNSGKETISKKQAIAHRISEMHVKAEAAKLLVYKAAVGIGKSRENTLAASTAKLFVSEAFVSVATEALNIHGGLGYLKDTGIERIVRDAMGSTIYSGTSDIQKNIIAGWKGI